MSEITYDDYIINLFKNNDLILVKKFHEASGKQFNNPYTIFYATCSHGKLDVAQWLHEICNININASDNYAFRKSCANGHLDIAKWLYKLGCVDIHENDFEAFFESYRNDHMEVAKWLYQIGNIKDLIKNSPMFRFKCQQVDPNSHIYNNPIFSQNYHIPAFLSMMIMTTVSIFA